MMCVYQAGPINQTDDPHSWREQLATTYPDYEWVNPLSQQDHADSDVAPTSVVSTDIQLLLDCDVLFVRREEGVETWGTPMEVLLAVQHSMPVVVWNAGTTTPSPWLRYHADVVRQRRDTVMASAPLQPK